MVRDALSPLFLIYKTYCKCKYSILDKTNKMIKDFYRISFAFFAKGIRFFCIFAVIETI